MPRMREMIKIAPAKLHDVPRTQYMSKVAPFFGEIPGNVKGCAGELSGTHHYAGSPKGLKNSPNYQPIPGHGLGNRWDFWDV